MGRRGFASPFSWLIGLIDNWCSTICRCAGELSLAAVRGKISPRALQVIADRLKSVENEIRGYLEKLQGKRDGK